VLDVVGQQIDSGNSIFEEYHLELLKSVRAYIASTGMRS
jgi:hypothetical protein